MLEIVQVLVLGLQLILQGGNLLFGLEIIVGNVQLEQDALGVRRLSPEAVDFAVFVDFVVDVGRDFLQVFFAFVAA